MPEAKNPQQAQFDKMTKTPIPRLVMGLAVPFMAQFLAELDRMDAAEGRCKT